MTGINTARRKAACIGVGSCPCHSWSGLWGQQTGLGQTHSFLNESLNTMGALPSQPGPQMQALWEMEMVVQGGPDHLLGKKPLRMMRCHRKNRAPGVRQKGIWAWNVSPKRWEPLAHGYRPSICKGAGFLTGAWWKTADWMNKSTKSEFNTSSSQVIGQIIECLWPSGFLSLKQENHHHRPVTIKHGAQHSTGVIMEIALVGLMFIVDS